MRYVNKPNVMPASAFAEFFAAENFEGTPFKLARGGNSQLDKAPGSFKVQKFTQVTFY